jgi:hypothetical protein
MDTPDSNGTGILQAAQLGNQEVALRKLAQAPTAHLPPLQRRCLGSGEEGPLPGAASPPILYPSGNRPEG